MPRTCISYSYCKAAAENLIHGLNWAHTPEGDSFWRDIHHRLLRYARGDEPAEALNAADQARASKEVKDRDDVIAFLQTQIEAKNKTIDEQGERIEKLKKRLIAADFSNMRNIRGM